VSELLVATGDALVRVAEDDAAVLLEQAGLQCVAAADGRIVVGCRGGGVWESADGGATWRDGELPANDVFSVAFGHVDGAVYAGCEPSALWVRRTGEPWRELAALRELPSAPTWSFPPRPWTHHVRWIAPSPREEGVVLVGIELGGLMRTTDGGETWEDQRPGAKLDSHAIAWHPTAPGRAYQAAGDGAAWSRDDGETWSGADLDGGRGYAWALAADAADPDRWYVSAAPGPFQAHGDGAARAGLFRWRGEGPWEELDLGLPRPLASMPYALGAADGSLFVALRDGRFFESRDAGDSWRPLGARVPKVVAMAVRS
jgi:photosystem II stability/assembly factor-like uncharacterized protein